MLKKHFLCIILQTNQPSIITKRQFFKDIVEAVLWKATNSDDLNDYYF